MLYLPYLNFFSIYYENTTQGLFGVHNVKKKK